jgi:HEAT repeat protein
MAAVMSLGAMGRPALASEFGLSRQALEKAKRDSDKSVQIWAAVALMAVDRVTKEGLTDVARHLGPKEKDGMAKVTAMRALGAMGKEAKPRIPDIINLVDDDDPLIAATAIDVLGQLGSVARDAIPALKKVTEKKDQTVYFKDAANAAIALIDGPAKPKK